MGISIQGYCENSLSLSSEAWLDYKRGETIVPNFLRSVESKYWFTKFNEVNSSKDFWRTVRYFDVSSKIGPVKNKEGVIHTDDTTNANTLRGCLHGGRKILALARS